MTPYTTPTEIKREDWPHLNVWYSFELLESFKGVWNAHYGSIKTQWGKDEIMKQPVLFVEITTGGWSVNEDYIKELLSNEQFVQMWHWKWERGGKYWFRIDPYSIGYKKAHEFGMSRQYIHKHPEIYERIKMGRNYLYRRVIK